MTSVYTSIILYERAGDKLVPVLTHSEPDHTNHGKLRAVRIQTLPWSALPFGAPTDEELGELTWTSSQFEPIDRSALIARGLLTPAAEWPAGPYLPLDAKGEACAAAEIAGLIQPDLENSWVASLGER